MDRNNPEIPQSLERSRSRSARERASEPTVTSAQVDQVVTQRLTMFGTVERYITVRLRQQLKEKIEFERKALLDIVSRQDAVQRAAKKAIHILNRAFFEQRPLDTSLLE
jgi:hypothetical protein